MINVTEPAVASSPTIRELAAAEAGAQFPGIAASSIAIGLLLGDGAHGRLAFGPEPFDSTVLGLRIGRIADTSAPSRDDYRVLFGELASRARADGYDQVLRRTGLDRLPEIWALERSGFELMDVGVTFGRVVRGPVDPALYEDLQVRASTDDDIEQIVEAMVRDPWGSRYESDPAYAPSRVRDLRSQWLWNSHRGRADAVLIGVLDGRPAGYVTCRLDRETGHGEIELVGTLPGFRGRRVAARVLAHAVSWFSTRATLITVRTQATNIAAANLYEAGGFALRSSDMTFRLDLDRSQGDRS
jgi:GNAT superfamily N-acetyltransferase